VVYIVETVNYCNLNITAILSNVLSLLLFKLFFEMWFYTFFFYSIVSACTCCE